MASWVGVLLAVNVAAGGDVQLGSASTPADLKGVRALLAGDVRLVNLEGPITAHGKEAGLDGAAPRFAAPERVAPWVASAVDVVSFANNHTLDQGAAGAADTVRVLGAAGVPVATEVTPAVVRRGAATLTVLARDLTSDEGVSKVGGLLTAVRAARGQGPVLVSVHWRHVDSLLPTEEERRIARALIDAGASAVLGHGPHVPQGVEARGAGVIAYSLGNLAFSCPCTKERDAYVLRFAVAADGRVSGIEATPVAAGLQAPPMRGDAELGQLLRGLSADLGTALQISQP
jgi:poly-gamma-glutamate capsule biosynthesis protein CapA/YwtB (metallophosphatase superfamily)